ncbi:hypothetical protein D3C81_1320350 [compost metagenome]
MLAVVPGDGAVRGLRLDGLAVGGHEDRRHEAEGAEALSHDVRLHVAVVVLARPDETTRPLDGGGHHVVDQTVFVGQAARLELFGVVGVEHFLEDVLEATVIGFEDGVLGRQIDRVVAGQAVAERGVGEVTDRRVEVVHAHGHTSRRRLEHFVLDHCAVFTDELDRQRALAWEQEVRGLVLVAKGVTADDDGLGPARNQTRHVLADDRLAENDAAQDVADGAVRRLPHLLQAEFGDAGFVRRDGGALDADPVLLDGVSRVDGDLVVRGVTAFHAQIVVVQLQIKVREDQLVLDPLPDDPGHFVAVDVHDGIGDLDLGHALPLSLTQGRNIVRAV